jgi:hypothetical protein
MKKAFVAFLTLISFSAFAGDLYLVCEDEKNDDFISATIENGKASMMIMAQDDQPLLLDVKQIKDADKTIFDLKVKILRQNKTEQMELSLFEEVTLGKYICLIRD